ncbi:MAG TPA: PQQ-binding-like beta-propeller repeat protein [Streptosporangiaceae bacterium]|jgi:hypothetical protein
MSGVKLIMVAVVAGALLAPAPAEATAAGPSITSFSPASGPVGTQVKISGAGFVTGDIVQFSGVTAKQAHVNPAGTRITATLPPLAPAGLISVIDPTGLRAQSARPFTVTRGITAAPAQQWPGGKTTFEGSAFARDATVTLTWNGSPFLSADTDANGNFTVGYHVLKTESPGLVNIGVLSYNVILHFSVSSNWPEYGLNSQHTGADPFELFLTESHVAAGLKVGPLFSVIPYLGSTSEVIGAPVLVGNVAYVVAAEPSTSSSKLMAFNRTTRTLIWASVAFGSSTSAPAVDGNRVFVASLDQHVYEFPTSCSNPCSPGWTSALAGGLFHASSPEAFDGDVFVAATDGKVYAYPESCSATCNPLWVSKATGGPIYGSPAVDNGVVYIGSSDDTVYAYSVACSKTCSPLWTSDPTGAAILGSPTVDGSSVFIFSTDGKLYAFPEKCSKSPCAPAWVSDPIAGNNATPAAVGGRVYIASGSTVYGYTESCSFPCAPVWQSQAEPGVFQGDAAIANGVLYTDNQYTASGSGILYAFDTTNSSCSPGCAPIWQSPPLQAVSDPAVSGSVYVGVADGGFYPIS